MQVLCDEHVSLKYVDALKEARGITVMTALDEFSAGASDTGIATHANANDWVVLTNDDGFSRLRKHHGLLFYSQVEDPSPGDVASAIQAIDYGYESNREVVEKVPNGWV